MRSSPWLAIFLIMPPLFAFGWRQPHQAITRASLETLPAWQKQLLGKELKVLGDEYCMIPDKVYADKANAGFAAMDSPPQEVYLQVLHLPTVQTEYLEVITFFMNKAVLALQQGRTADAARFMGTICHQIEDYGSPSHTMPRDNQFTLLQQFLPPSDGVKDKLMHGPVENGEFTLSLPDYQPNLLGVSVNEAAWRLMHRVHEGIINARSTTIPILQALYEDDTTKVTKHQMRAAITNAQIVADAMFTILCLGAQKLPQMPASVLIDTFWPLEAEKLHYPQTQFFQLPLLGVSACGIGPCRRHENGSADA